MSRPALPPLAQQKRSARDTTSIYVKSLIILSLLYVAITAFIGYCIGVKYIARLAIYFGIATSISFAILYTGLYSAHHQGTYVFYCRLAFAAANTVFMIIGWGHLKDGSSLHVVPEGAVFLLLDQLYNLMVKEIKGLDLVEDPPQANEDPEPLDRQAGTGTFRHCLSHMMPTKHLQQMVKEKERLLGDEVDLV